ncbi:unnamed protein product, partial [Candidula unifasciata]
MVTRKWLVGRIHYLALVIVTALLLLQPLRLVLMDLVLPTAWADTDKVHLYRVINDYQHFDVDAHPLQRDVVWEKVQVNLSHFQSYLYSRRQAYREFHNYLGLLKSLPKGDEEIQKKMELISKFQPVMTPREAAQLLFSFETFTNACAQAGLIYFILEASLMGSVRHHGFIPWDDDIDIVMNAKQWPRIRNVLGNIEGFELYAPSKTQWKFYMKSAKAFPDKPFKFPNIDIFFYEEDDTHIWALTRGLKHDLVYLKSDVFPLQIRPFENLMVPVPCNLDIVVHKSHNKDMCVTPEYNHKTNENFYFMGGTSVHCKLLYDLYPF